MRPKASWAGLICRTDQCFQRQRLPYKYTIVFIAWFVITYLIHGHEILPRTRVQGLPPWNLWGSASELKLETRSPRSICLRANCGYSSLSDTQFYTVTQKIVGQFYFYDNFGKGERIVTCFHRWIQKGSIEKTRVKRWKLRKFSTFASCCKNKNDLLFSETWVCILKNWDKCQLSAR